MSQARSLPPIADLVPHGPPMLLLTELSAWTLDEAVCVGCVPQGHPLADGQCVPAAVGLELMAQCTAAYLGMLAREHDHALGGGLLAGAPELTLHTDGFEVTAPVRVRVERVWGHGQIWRFAGEVSCGDTLVVAGMLDVIRTPPHGDA